MKLENAKILLNILIENSARILRAGFGVNSAESAFFAVIDLIYEYPMLKYDLLACAKTTLRESDPGKLDVGMIPKELLELISHEMRWAELRELAAQRVCDIFHGDWSRAMGDISLGIVNAQSSDWADREFYKHYTTKS